VNLHDDLIAAGAAKLPIDQPDPCAALNRVVQDARSPASQRLVASILARCANGLATLFELRPNAASRASTAIADALAERVRQLAKWGDQSHPCVPWEIEPARAWDERMVAERMEVAAKADCEREFKAGRGTWWHIANEELAEVLAAPPEKRRQELVQLTAVCLAWLEDMDNKAGTRSEDSSS